MTQYRYLGYLQETFQDPEIIQDIVNTFLTEYKSSMDLLDGHPTLDQIRSTVHKLKATLSVFRFADELALATQIEHACGSHKVQYDGILKDVRQFQDQVQQKIAALQVEYEQLNTQ